MLQLAVQKGLEAAAAAAYDSAKRMSVSSLGAAAVAVGSTGDAVSEAGSADSLFIRDIHDRREQKRQELEKQDSDSDSDGGGLLHDLLKHFRHCCASRRKGCFAPADTAAAAAAAVAAAAGPPKGPYRMRTYSTSGSSSSSSSSTAARSAVSDKYIGDLAHLVSWRIVLGQGPGGCMRPQGAGVPMGGPGGLLGPPNLTANQAAWAACSWCVRLENNEKMTGSQIHELLTEAESQKTTLDVMRVIEDTAEFKTLMFARRVDGSRAEDILGDFSGLYLDEVQRRNQPANLVAATAGGAIYAVVYAARVVGLYARKHGELVDFVAFNVMPTERERFPPSYMGFKTLDDMQEYVLELYKRDPRVKRSGGGVSALLFKSRTLHKFAEQRADYTAYRETQADRLALLEDLREKDPKYDAKMLYTNMYKATKNGQNDPEIFALQQGVGMQIENKEVLKKTQKFMSRDELLDET